MIFYQGFLLNSRDPPQNLRNTQGVASHIQKTDLYFDLSKFI